MLLGGALQECLTFQLLATICVRSSISSSQISGFLRNWLGKSCYVHVFNTTRVNHICGNENIMFQRALLVSSYYVLNVIGLHRSKIDNDTRTLLAVQSPQEGCRILAIASKYF